MQHVVLYEPEIPHNTGAVGRLCLATGARLHLICPLGFSLEDKHLKRAGLDYWKEVDVQVWPDWASFLQELPAGAKMAYLTTKTERCYWQTDLAGEVYLVFGPETRGLPQSLLQTHAEQTLRIPMQGTRSLNLATAVGIVLYEAVRQTAVA